MEDEMPGAQEQGTASTFANRLNELFRTRLSSRGKPYTLREVSEGTNGLISIGYLSFLRKGNVAMPSGDRIQALANFFGVDVAYLAGTQTVPEQTERLDEELRAALAKPGVRTLALRAGQLDDEDRELLLQWAERVHRQAARERSKTTGTSRTMDDRV
jgi:transcriptional regulator with XRE-family HTH domain